MVKKLKIAFIEDDNNILGENIFHLSETSLFNFEFFRKNPELWIKKDDYLNLKLAREKLMSFYYDGIILDDYMLREDVYPQDEKNVGEHLLIDIRSHDVNKETPVIIYGHGSDREHIKKYEKLGANIYIVKHTGYLQDDIKSSSRVNIFKNYEDPNNLVNLIISLPSLHRL